MDIKINLIFMLTKKLNKSYPPEAILNSLSLVVCLIISKFTKL